MRRGGSLKGSSSTMSSVYWASWRVASACRPPRTLLPTDLSVAASTIGIAAEEALVRSVFQEPVVEHDLVPLHTLTPVVESDRFHSPTGQVVTGYDGFREPRRECTEPFGVAIESGMQGDSSGDSIRAQAVEDRLFESHPGGDFRVRVERIPITVQPIQKGLVGSCRDRHHVVRFGPFGQRRVESTPRSPPNLPGPARPTSAYR